MMFSDYSYLPPSSPLMVDELIRFAKQFERPPIECHFAIGVEEAIELVEKQGFPDEIWVSDAFWEQLTALPCAHNAHPFHDPGTPVRRCQYLLDPYIFHWKKR